MHGEMAVRYYLLLHQKELTFLRLHFDGRNKFSNSQHYGEREDMQHVKRNALIFDTEERQLNGLWSSLEQVLNGTIVLVIKIRDIIARSHCLKLKWHFYVLQPLLASASSEASVSLSSDPVFSPLNYFYTQEVLELQSCCSCLGPRTGTMLIHMLS